MDRMNRIGRMKWMLMMVGMVSIPVYSMAVAQAVSLPQGNYHLAAMPAAAAEGAGQGTQPQVKDDLFAGTEIFEKGASDVTEITMDPDTLDLVGGKDGKRAHNMILNVVRTYEYDKPGMYRMEDVDAFRNKLNSGDWHCSVHTRDLKTGESTDICNKRRSDGLAETAIITVEPKELTFIHTIRRKGDSESDVSGLPLMLSMPGLSSLAMLDPEEFIDMKVAMHMLDSGAMQMQIDSAMKGLHVLVLPEIQLKIDSAMKDMQGHNNDELKLKLDEAMKDREKVQKELKLEQPKPDSATPKDDQPKEPE